MRIVKLTKETKENILNDLLKRSPNNYSEYESTVNDILADVRERGDQALFEYTLKFDRFALNEDNIRVTRAEIEEDPARLAGPLGPAQRQAHPSGGLHPHQPPGGPADYPLRQPSGLAPKPLEAPALEIGRAHV